MSCGFSWRLRLPLTALALVAGSCGITGGTDDTDGDDRLRTAWNRFHQGQFEGAATLFDELAMEDVSLAESYGGLGWSRLRLLNPGGARQAFQSSLVADAEWMDSRAGEVFAMRDAGSGADALLGKAREVLRLDPDWRFSHDNTVDWRDVRVLSAQVFFYTQRFDSCLVNLQLVDDVLALSRADTTSWQGATSFELALLAELERVTAWVSE